MKPLSFFYLLLAMCTCLECRSEENSPTDNFENRTFFLDANLGYFYPFSKDLREVISGGINYELLLTYQCNKYIGVIFGGDFFIQQGHSTGTHSKSTLWILPLTLGIKVSADFWTTCNREQVLQGYFLLGPRWYFAEATNSSSTVDKHNFAQNIGGVGGIGISYFYKHLNLNIFTDYSFCNLHTKTSVPNLQTPNTQVGGLTAGGGIGWNY